MESERQRMAMELQQKESERQRTELERQCLELERQRMALELQQKESERQRMESELQQKEFERQQKESERQQMELRMESERQRKELELQQKEAERQRMALELQQKESERQRMELQMESERHRMELQMESERQQKESERQRMESERQQKESELQRMESELHTLKQEKFNLLANDERVAIFSASGSDRTPHFPLHDYWTKCLCCGTKTNVVRAHLVVNSEKFKGVYPQFSKFGGYSTDFEGISERNHIPLCGTLGQLGTCHHSFDSAQMSLIYNPFSRLFKIYWPKNKVHHQKVVTIPEAKKPYRRLLVWRARHDAIRNYDLELLRLSNICEGAKCSVASTSAAQPKKKRKRKQATPLAKVVIPGYSQVRNR